MVGHVPMEVAITVLEVADVAWTAVETCHRHQHHQETAPSPPDVKERGDCDPETLRSENERLRRLLEKNLSLLEQISSSPTLLQNCPSDLHRRLLESVNSESFLNELESHREQATCKFPFDEPSDLEKAEILINVDHEEPSWWVWVTEEMVPSNIEEKSGIDSENYVVVTEEHVVDGVANFMARCILANPKALKLSPLELQKALMKALGGINKVEKMVSIWHAGKVFYTLATWGLALASLYEGRAILRMATLGVHHSSKLALKAL